LPLAAKIRSNVSRESLYYAMNIEGILSIQAGDNPLMLEEKLKAFITESPAVKAERAGNARVAEPVEALQP
jgi:chemotaxis protein MotA